MKQLKILYLEDSPQDAELASRALKKAGIAFEMKLVDKEDEFRKELGEYKPDLILSDHSLVQFNSVEALRIFKQFDYKIPFILVTGTVSEEFAVTILKEGANDYLLKDNLSRLPSAVLNALDKFRAERERQLYLENIIANEEMLKQAEQLARFGSWQMDLETGKVKWSDETFRIYGYEPGEIEPDGETFFHHVVPEDAAVLKRELRPDQAKADSKEFEFSIIDKKGNRKYLEARMVIEPAHDGKAARYIGFNLDITARKEAEQKLLKSVQELAKLEKELVQQQLRHQKLITEVTIQAQEKERNELARELHDNINQVLASVKMFLNIAKDEEVVHKALVSRSYENVSYAIEEIRKLSKSLVAPSLGDIGLLAALQELVEEVSLADGPEVTLNFESKEHHKLDTNMELMLYRIIQEQLNNIFKYARASRAIITLKVDDKNVFLSVADNGIGFNPSAKAKGIGLKNISSRVEFYSGTLDIVSAPGEGCTLNITIPIKKNETR